MNFFLASKFLAKYGANCGIERENPKLNHNKSRKTKLYEFAHAENSNLESFENSTNEIVVFATLLIVNKIPFQA